MTDFLCPLAEQCLPRIYERVLAEMRLMERVGRGGGMIKLFWDGRRWKVAVIRSAKEVKQPHPAKTS